MKALDLIDLSLGYGIGAIILLREDPDAIEVSNQVGGHACHHRVATGLVYFKTTFEGLEEHFEATLGEYGGWCCDGISEKTADFLDQNLKHRAFKVDRSKLKDCQEAWIFGFYEGDPAILTWGNSD